MSKIYLLLPILFVWINACLAQSEPISKKMQLPLQTKKSVLDITNDFFPGITKLNPLELNPEFNRLQKIKDAVEKKYPRKENLMKGASELSSDSVLIGHNFKGNSYGNNTPNDNTLAISNSGILLSAINSSLNFYQISNDSILKSVSLQAFSDTLSLAASKYDPKVLYDPSVDRFVVVYLSGFNDSTSNIVVGFSNTSDPLGVWNLYALPGDPLADTSWTDFPAIAVSDSELFITVNLLRNDASWQTAFKQTVIWQIDKTNGYQGDSLNMRLWYNINFEGINIRNLHPVPGGNASYGNKMFLLSNRNFSLQCDSVFLLELTNTMNSPNVSLSVSLLQSDVKYGMPPNGRQNHSSNMLATNDARALGAFYNNNQIQYVANSLDTLTGSAAIFHGIISNMDGQRILHGKILSESASDFGYPNISLIETVGDDCKSMISFDHTGPLNLYPGVSAIIYSGNGLYSARRVIKTGTSYIDVLTGADRWGDYSGSQIKYNEPGKVWISGTFGTSLPVINYKINGTWIAEVFVGQTTDEIQISNSISSVQLFPNPSVGNQTVFVKFEITKSSYLTFTLFEINGKEANISFNESNISGKDILKRKLKEGAYEFSFNTNNLKTGTYLLQISDHFGEKITKKIIHIK